MNIQDCLLAITIQAVEYVRECNGKPKPHFVKHADNVIIVAKAITLGRTVGQQEGWDVFDIGNGYFAVQSDDDMDIIDDNKAIKLARKAGVLCDDDGNIVNKEREVIRLD